MKYFYFIRHGESTGNAGSIYQGSTSRLSELGRKQANIIAERCTKLPIESMISSSLPRAEETAQIISEKIKLPFEVSELLIEIKRPSQQIGLERDGVESKKIDEEIIRNFSVYDYRYSDEENSEDLDERARKVLEYLENQKSNHVLIVTHGLFLRIIIGKAIFGKNFTSHICQDVLNNMRTNNAGLTLMEFNESNHQWLLRAYNDFAHLG